MTQTWKSQLQAVDIEIHYVLRAGLSGLHTYAVVRHPASYPATKFGEWRMVWKPPSDLLDTICVDRLRFSKMPTAADFARAKPTDIAEIVQLTTGPWAGKFDSKGKNTFTLVQSRTHSPSFHVMYDSLSLEVP